MCYSGGRLYGTSEDNNMRGHVSFTNNTKPLGMALRGAYTRGLLDNAAQDLLTPAPHLDPPPTCQEVISDSIVPTGTTSRGVGGCR